MKGFHLKKELNGIAYYTRENMSVHKEKMLELLEVFVDVCNENNIDYWLDGGGLLGLVRHDDMIPWDDDIDICVPAYDYFRCLDLLAERSKKSDILKLFFRSQGLSSWCEYFVRTDYFYITKSGFKRNINIDIFPVKFIPKNKLDDDFRIVEQASYFVKNFIKHKFKSKNAALLKKKDFFEDYNKYIVSHSKYNNDAWLIKGHGQYSPIKKVCSNIVYPLKEREFCGIQVKVPGDLNSYLIESYGVNYKNLPPLEKRKPEGVDTLRALTQESGEFVLQQSVQIEYETFFYSTKILNIAWKLKKLFKQNGWRRTFRIIVTNLIGRK